MTMELVWLYDDGHKLVYGLMIRYDKFMMRLDNGVMLIS